MVMIVFWKIEWRIYNKRILRREKKIYKNDEIIEVNIISQFHSELKICLPLNVFNLQIITCSWKVTHIISDFERRMNGSDAINKYQWTNICILKHNKKREKTGKSIQFSIWEMRIDNKQHSKMTGKKQNFNHLEFCQLFAFFSTYYLYFTCINISKNCSKLMNNSFILHPFFQSIF